MGNLTCWPKDRDKTKHTLEPTKHTLEPTKHTMAIRVPCTTFDSIFLSNADPIHNTLNYLQENRDDIIDDVHWSRAQYIEGASRLGFKPFKPFKPDDLTDKKN